MRRPSTATAAAIVLVWLAALTVAFHGYGGGGFLAKRRTAASVVTTVVVPARKMLLAVTSFDAAAASSSSTDHHHHHHHHHQHHQHQHQHHHADRLWNRQGIPPSSSVGKQGEEIDPRYGVQKRLVPTGPNPLHH